MRKSYEHWSLDTDKHNILWLTLDKANASANTMNAAVLAEMKEVLAEIRQKSPVAVVLSSAKSSGFVLGADIEYFSNLDDINVAREFIQLGQDLYGELSTLPCPTIAVIEGFALGGGLELALSCTYRIVEDSPKVRLGLPEVKLGIQPGWRGTVNLAEKVGGPKALDMMLTGRMVRPKAAKAMGFVDEVVPRRLLKQVVTSYALKPPIPKQPSLLTRLTNADFVRPLLAKMVRKQVAKKARPEHYPAPYAIIDNWVQHGTRQAPALKAEVDSLCHLMTTDTAKNLVRVFFLQEKLKGLAKGSDFKPRHVHVIGAGVMGGDIAAWCAFKGMHVTLQDQSATFIGGAIKRAHRLVKKRFKEKHEQTAMIDRLVPDVAGRGIAQADVIIEAITEKLEAKQALFKALEAKARPDAILATNTSTIPLEEISTALSAPERLVGIHYFNPVALMPLVEIVKSDKTEQSVVDKAVAFVGKIGKLPLPVKSAPGFLVNRILLPYMLEAVSLLEEGVSGPAIDQAAESFGMPMGPIELADKVGLDICMAALEKMKTHFGTQLPEKLKILVAEGRLGEKTGRGFYEYKQGKPVKGPVEAGFKPQDIIDRLSLRMVNEAVACLREGIVEDADLLDAGTIFGFGFPPFRGGAISHARQIGCDTLKKQLEKLEARFGERFHADEGWGHITDKRDIA